MPTIIRNDVKYCSSNLFRKLTLNEYNKLVDRNLVNEDVIYCITDAQELNLAENISYNDTNTGFNTFDAQSATEKLNENVNERFELFAFQGFERDNLSLAYGKTSTLSFDVTKEGYTPIGVLRYGSYNATTSGSNYSLINFYEITVDPSTNTLTSMVRNRASSSTAKFKVNFLLLYIKSEYFSNFEPIYNTL